MRLDVYVHLDHEPPDEGRRRQLCRIEDKVDLLLSRLARVEREEKHMGDELNILTEKVTKVEGVVESGKAAIVGLADALRDLSGKFTDYESLKAGVLAHAASLDATADGLAAAIAENPVPTP